jgi:hypothetical protein
MLSLSLLSACTEVAPQRVGDSTGTTPVSTTPAAPPPATIFKAGDTVQYGDLHISVNGFRTSKGGTFMKPDNDFYLIIDLTIENRGAKTSSISSYLSMELVDPDKYKHDVAVFADTVGSFDGQLGAGRKVRGEVAFDVDQHEYYEFVFSEPFASGQAIWKLEYKDANKAFIPVASLGPPPTTTPTFAVGDAVKFGDLVITVNSFRTSTGQSFMTPDLDQFIIVNLTIENKGSKSAAISSVMQMELVDAQWYKYDVAIFADTKGSLDGELGPGRSVRGEVGFDVRRHDQYEFIFSEPFASGLAIWVLK